MFAASQPLAIPAYTSHSLHREIDREIEEPDLRRRYRVTRRTPYRRSNLDLIDLPEAAAAARAEHGAGNGTIAAYGGRVLPEELGQEATLPRVRLAAAGGAAGRIRLGPLPAAARVRAGANGLPDEQPLQLPRDPLHIVHVQQRRRLPRRRRRRVRRLRRCHGRLLHGEARRVSEMRLTDCATCERRRGRGRRSQVGRGEEARMACPPVA
ncbi:hypothetical protein ACQJBY_058141 [Aegilops geniculata]